MATGHCRPQRAKCSKANSDQYDTHHAFNSRSCLVRSQDHAQVWNLYCLGQSKQGPLQRSLASINPTCLAISVVWPLEQTVSCLHEKADMQLVGVFQSISSGKISLLFYCFQRQDQLFLLLPMLFAHVQQNQPTGLVCTQNAA